MLNYLLQPNFQFCDINGRPLVGGYIEVYLHNTTTQYITKSDFGGTNNPFKVPLNSKGMAVVIAESGQLYDVFIYNIFGSLFWSGSNIAVNINQDIEGEGPIDVDISGTDPLQNIVIKIKPNSIENDKIKDHTITYEKLEDGTLNFVTPEMFGAVGDGVTDDSEALMKASMYGVVELGNKTYRTKEAIRIQNKCLFRNGKIVADFAEYTGTFYFVFYIDGNNYEVVFDNIEIVCENPASYVNHTSYNRLEAIRVNDNDGTSLKCLNCNIVGARQFVNAKGESKIYIEGCNVQNTYEFVYANKSKIVVLNSCFVQASGTDNYVHFLYQAGGGDLTPYNNYAFISNCDITTNSATFNPGSGSNPNGTTFDLFIFNCSIKVLSSGCFYTFKGVKYFIDGCKIDCVSDVFASFFVNCELTIENSIVVNCNKMSSAFIGTLNAINCSFIGKWAFTDGASVLNFKNCTLDFTGSTTYCFYVPYDVNEIKFYNCNLLNPTTQLIFYAKCNNKYYLYNCFIDSEDVIPITFNPLDVYNNGIWFYNSVVKTSRSNWNDTTKVHTISNFMLP